MSRRPIIWTPVVLSFLLFGIIAYRLLAVSSRRPTHGVLSLTLSSGNLPMSALEKYAQVIGQRLSMVNGVMQVRLCGAQGTADAYQPRLLIYRNGQPVAVADAEAPKAGAEKEPIRNIQVQQPQRIILAVWLPPDAKTAETVTAVMALLPDFQSNILPASASIKLWDGSMPPMLVTGGAGS